MYQKTEVIPIPLSCPRCEDKMVVIRYDASLKILKERSWQVCRNCGFERSIEDFKKKLLTA